MRKVHVGIAAAAAWIALIGAAPGRPDPVDTALRLSDMRQSGFIFLCAGLGSPGVPKPETAAVLMAQPLPPPARAFDNLYFVGSRWTNAWAIRTSAGIILLDAMDNGWEAEHIIADGLKRVGLDPATIRYVIVSHGHWDHYGGATWLKTRYGARVVMSAIDWELVEKDRGVPPREGREAPPERDIAVADGDVITLGDTKVTLHLTPGHTLGTLSPTFDVMQGGRRHRAMLWGGSSFNFGRSRPNQLQAYLDSARGAPAWVRRERIDTLLSNHPQYDRSLVKFAAMAGQPRGPNAFVIGEQGVLKTLTTMEQCALATQVAWSTPSTK